MLYFKAMKGNPELPDAFQGKRFRSYVDMANFADEHQLPHGAYWIRNDSGKNLLTAMRELNYSKLGFHVEGRGNI